MSVAVKYTASLVITETPSTNVDALAAGQSLKLNGFDRVKNYDGVSGPQATVGAAFKKALSSGSGTIDLTAIPITGGGTADGTGLKVLAARFQNLSTNANPVTVTVGASNGYLLAGAAWKLILQPGDDVILDLTKGTTKNAPAVDSTHKTIDLSGTGSQQLCVELVLG